MLLLFNSSDQDYASIYFVLQAIRGIYKKIHHSLLTQGGGGRNERKERKKKPLQAHFPKSAISPAPKHIIPNAFNTTLNLALLIVGLNMNSCAISSTSPV